MNTSGLPVHLMDDYEFIILYKHKINQISKGKAEISELTKMLAYAKYFNPDVLKHQEECDNRCIWYIGAQSDKNKEYSSLSEDHIKHNLWRCAYQCEGNRENCLNYRTILRGNKDEAKIR